MSSWAIALVALTVSTFADDTLPRLREAQPAWMSERDDPGSDGWATEVFSDAAAQQLERLATWMEAAPGAGIDLAVLAHESFTAGAFGLRVIQYQRRVGVQTAASQAPAATTVTIQSLPSGRFVISTLRPYPNVRA